jgi:DNA repair exonuclease SbcCD ATPase subunit
MFVLKKIKIRGFRGYTDEKELSLDAPVVLLFGENHHGKSSTLNGIEWCLYGGKCIGKDTGIRERINWEIKNRNFSSEKNVFVELLLEDRNGNIYKLSRELISKTKDELEIILPDGGKLKGKEAEAILSGILRSSFRDFLTTVYQHQEAIRAILTQEPKDRNDAIDRLLGLSDYRNIISGIATAKVEETLKNMTKSLDAFKGRFEERLKARQQDLEDKKRKLIEKGIKEEQLNEKGAIKIFESILKEIEEFANNTGLSFSGIPKLTDFEKLTLQLANINELIKTFRSELPDLRKRNNLMEQKLKIDSLILEYKQKKEKIKEVEKKIETIVNEYGDEDKLQKLKLEIKEEIGEKEKKMKKLDLKGKMIKDAIEYLKEEGIDKNICPVCEKETPGLLEHLQEEWDKKFKEKFKKINEEIEKLGERLKEIDGLIKNLETYKDDLERYKKDLSESTGKIELFLGKKLTPEDDPIGLLNRCLDDIANQLETLEKAIKAKYKKLDEIQEKLKQVYEILEVLDIIEKINIIENIKKTPEYQRMEELKNKITGLDAHIKEIMEVIKKVSHEQAEKLIREAEKTINEYFLKITNNPAIKEIKLSVDVDSSGKNSYSFRDQNNRDLTPVLSQGDLNALALSIFLAMASLKGSASSFDFIILDDPSQSLGSEHKKNFVEVLDQVANNKRILLATMDRELQELLTQKLTKAKKIYYFKKWNPFTGPEIEEI